MCQEYKCPICGVYTEHMQGNFCVDCFLSSWADMVEASPMVSPEFMARYSK